jgi:hypothetical protein
MKRKAGWLVLLAVAILALTITPALAGGDKHRRRWKGERFALVGEVAAVEIQEGTISVMVLLGSRAIKDHIDLELTLVTNEDTRFRSLDDPPGEPIELEDIEVGDIISAGGHVETDSGGEQIFVAHRVTKDVPYDMSD